jgi:hypothetical protein
MYSAPYSCPILTKLELSRQIFEKKYSNIKFTKILQVGTELFPADKIKLTVAFRNLANAPQNWFNTDGCSEGESASI